MSRKLAVIGVGNMAKAIIAGIIDSGLDITSIILYDKDPNQYSSVFSLKNNNILFSVADSVSQAISLADTVLLSVKPQNYPEILSDIVLTQEHSEKLYISIGAGISSQSVSASLSGAPVVRVLPNVPMLIGMGVSVICENTYIPKVDFDFVCNVFNSAGSSIIINENDMNAMIGVTSSSPAYVFRFIDAIYNAAIEQGLSDNDGTLIESICDVVIGSATMLKKSHQAPRELVSRVASKGGTTERALAELDSNGFDTTILSAMKACTARANELGNTKK